MTDKTSDDGDDKISDDGENVVNLIDFKSNKLKQNIEAKPTSASKPEKPEPPINTLGTIEAKQQFAVDILSRVLSYAVIELHRIAETSTDANTINYTRDAISNIDKAVVNALNILKG